MTDVVQTGDSITMACPECGTAIENSLAAPPGDG